MEFLYRGNERVCGEGKEAGGSSRELEVLVSMGS